MNFFGTRRLTMAVTLLIRHGKTRVAQEEPRCVDNSPERRGKTGCSIVEIKRLPVALKEPVFWQPHVAGQSVQERFSLDTTLDSLQCALGTYYFRVHKRPINAKITTTSKTNPNPPLG
jgi:hypothetical protein